MGAARACGVTRRRIERLLREETSVTADTALRPGKYLATSAQFWLNLQTVHDLRVAEKEARKAITGIVLLRRSERCECLFVLRSYSRNKSANK